MSRFNFRVWYDVPEKYFYGYPQLGLTTDGEVASLAKSGIIEQSTGLTDCEDKEIFEGDILSCEWQTDCSPGPIYDESAVGGIKWIGSGFYIIQMDGTLLEGCDLKEMLDQADCEILGNIHENPELLKEGK